MDWLQSEPAFRKAAEKVIRATKGDDPEAFRSVTKLLVDKYDDSPLAHTIAAAGYQRFNDLDNALFELKRATELAPRCPYAAACHATVLRLMGSFDEAVEECDRALAVLEHTDPVRHYPLMFKVVLCLDLSAVKLRIASTRERIRLNRAMAEKGKGTSVSLEPACTLKWPPEGDDLARARARWSRMTEEERKAFLVLSFEEMEWYCSSGLVPQQSRDRMMCLLSGAKEFIMEGWSSYWICPICFVIGVDSSHSTRFMSHIEKFHPKEYKELRLSVPERISESEKELLLAWRWEPIDGDDLPERTKVLSIIKETIFQLIDLDVVSVNLLLIVHKFIMKRVRPVTPTEVSMCASCGIGRLSFRHLMELYELLQLLTCTYTDYEHKNGHGDEQQSKGDSSVVLSTWSEQCNVVSFDCDKVASTKTDGSSQADALFTGLFCEPLLQDPIESWVGLWRNCIDQGPGILKKIGETLDKLKQECITCDDQLKAMKGVVYSSPMTMRSHDFDIKPYFHHKIGSAHVNMLVIDAEVNYWKTKFLEKCRVDYLRIISPIAKFCLWAKLNDNRPEVQPGIFFQSSASISRYQNSVDVLKKNNETLHLCFLNVIVESLWNLRHFRDEFLRIQPPFCYKMLGGPCIAEKLYEIFSAWMKNEHYRTVVLLTDLKNTLCEPGNDRNIFQNVGRNFASEIMAMILEGLHNSEISWSSGFPILSMVQANFHARNLFGIKLKQFMICSCGTKWFGEEYTSVFHKLDANSPHATKINSFAQLPMLMDLQSNCESKCNNCSGNVKQVRHFLSKQPHFFTIVLKNGLGGDESQAILSEALYGITSPLDITLLYDDVTFPSQDVHSATKYRLASVICYVEERYVCFVRDQDKWLKYDTMTVKEVNSFGELLQLYREIHLQPEVLIYEVE